MSAKRPHIVPDLVLVAGRCHTLSPSSGRPQALAIANGRIVAVGSRRAVLRHRGRRTRVVDLSAATVTPGLVDCHTHFFYWALGRAMVIDVLSCPTLDKTLSTIRERARLRRLGEWVVARGYDHNRWPSGWPSATDLDRVLPDRPVIVHARHGHQAWLNSVAMKRAGITRRTPDPPGGAFVRDARGRPTGIVLETAVEHLPNPLRDFALRTDAAAQRVVDRAMDEAYHTAWAHGIVRVHTMDDAPSLTHLQRHRAEGWLGLRVVHAIPLAGLSHACQLGLRSGLGDEWLRIGGVKIFVDGALGSQTAYMFDPYPGRGGYCGVPVLAGDELKEAVQKAVSHGWAVWIHAIGDRAVHEAINAITATRRLEQPAMPHRIEHVQCVRPADVRRMARAGIVASVQPCHLLGDIDSANRHWPRSRRHAYVFRRLLEADVVLAGGSDAPIESIDPRRSLFAATRRTDEQGNPPGGWFPQQRITAEETLQAFTRGAATAVGTPAPAGTLTPGAPADLTIWEEDPLSIPPEKLLETRILGCVVGGQVHMTHED